MWFLLSLSWVIIFDFQIISKYISYLDLECSSFCQKWMNPWSLLSSSVLPLLTSFSCSKVLSLLYTDDHSVMVSQTSIATFSSELTTVTVSVTRSQNLKEFMWLPAVASCSRFSFHQDWRLTTAISSIINIKTQPNLCGILTLITISVVVSINHSLWTIRQILLFQALILAIQYGKFVFGDVISCSTFKPYI